MENQDVYSEGKVYSLKNDIGLWVNTQVFREAGNKFYKDGYYNADPEGSPDWFKFWTQERKRCLEGYEVAGARITGEHYAYLNYYPLQKVDVTSISGNYATKIEGFPDFWDGDYNYFWCREIARKGALSINHTNKEIEEILKKPKKEILKECIKSLVTIHLSFQLKLSLENLLGGKDFVIGKARRRGFSNKNALIGTNNFLHRPKKLTFYMAYEKKYLYPGKDTIFGKSLAALHFIYKNTAWIMPSDVTNKQDHIKNSYIEYVSGIKVEQGMLSEIKAVSFKNNADAGRGIDAYDIIGEEVGAWGVPGGLKAAISAMRSSSEAGIYKTGMMTFFGTSGDIEKGTADFADIFNRPEANNFLAFHDIWGPAKEKVEGFFFPSSLNKEGFYDLQGNSDIKGAADYEIADREKLKEAGATSMELNSRLQEEPLNSGEAFNAISRNTFPVVELNAQLMKVKMNKLFIKKSVAVDLVYVESGVEARPILDGSKSPIVSFRDIPIDLRGCPVIYEQPIPNAPKGLYKIGYDPVRQDEGTSLAGIIVYKSFHRGSMYHDLIVAEYIGRLETPEDIDRIAEKFAMYYNTTIMYENEVVGVKTFFKRIKKLHLLASQPDLVINHAVKKSRVRRVYGCHMVEKLKDAGERYVKEWLLSEVDYDEEGGKVRVLDRIYSTRLLEELIAYYRDGNFDGISALFMCLFQVQEEEYGKEYDEKKKQSSVAIDLLKQLL